MNISVIRSSVPPMSHIPFNSKSIRHFAHSIHAHTSYHHCKQTFLHFTILFGTVYLASDFAKLDRIKDQLQKIQSFNDKLFMADTLRVADHLQHTHFGCLYFYLDIQHCILVLCRQSWNNTYHNFFCYKFQLYDIVLALLVKNPFHIFGFNSEMGCLISFWFSIMVLL